MTPPAVKRLAAAAAAFVLVFAVAPRAAAASTVQGKLAPSPDLATPSFDLWDFAGPGNGSTVMLTLTYAPNGNAVDAPTAHTFDQLIGFNVYGEDGQLFGHSTVMSAGRATWSFQSTSVHQYTAKVFNYAESSAAAYTLAADNATLVAPVTPTPTPNPLVSRAPANPVSIGSAPASAATATPTSVAHIVAPAAPPSSAASGAVLAKAGDQVQGRLVGALTGAKVDYQVAPTADNGPTTLRLSAQQGALIQNVEATLDVYQVKGGVNVLIAVGLPEMGNFSVAAVTFPAGANGYGNYLAEITNSAPGQPLDYTLARS